ncbi:MAG: metal-dependent phosphohydrolase [Armatimonadetes bacterium]|nr:metal-dependent phosphohydrolase [Armatimonadota bacterium]
MQVSFLQKLKKPEAHRHRLPQVLHAIEILLVEQKDRDLDRDRDLDWEYEHMNESIRYAKMLALRRKIDPDLAACAAAIQNIGRIIGGKTEGHAETGYEPAKRLLTGMGCFAPDEIEKLASSVRNHSQKETTGTPLDELAKDVDVYARYIQGDEFTSPHEERRLARIRLELQTKI